MQQSDDPAQLIDFEALRQHMAQYDNLLLRLLELFLEQVPGWHREIDEAFASGEPERVRRICHKIKGSAATLQARCIIEAAANLGAHAANQGLAEAADCRCRLVTAIDATVAFIEQSGYLAT